MQHGAGSRPGVEATPGAEAKGAAELQSKLEAGCASSALWMLSRGANIGRAGGTQLVCQIFPSGVKVKKRRTGLPSKFR